ncbi:heme o synthase [Parendozoicomonas sp. Alg238-R29]|uniref:heme o synthase n=1 Tax=Parendozoicomonas sp. Alg238-R29 TaxID=2993446 RepID=UPI00248D3D7A|nr:heme o synthase [Parendozoicomonas sp. Alg238-R29]
MGITRASKTVIVEPAGWRDYLELCKPKVVALMVLTVVIGMCLATPGMVPLDILFLGNIGIALCAGSAAVINHVVDRRIDTVMARTMKRPVATGKVEPLNALLFALVIGVAGMGILLAMVNPLTAWLTLASLLGYAVVYTLFLKRATPQNIVIGGIAGAAPPLLGWTAVTGEFHGNALLLVLIIFAWTPPHFWALAIHRKEEYAKADIPMLPVTHGEAYTKLHILLYTVILLLVSLMPWMTGMSGMIYLLGASALGLRFLYWAVALLRESRPHAAIKTFHYSITYLMLLFVVLLADHYLYLG